MTDPVRAVLHSELPHMVRDNITLTFRILKTLEVRSTFSVVQKKNWFKRYNSIVQHKKNDGEND